MHITYLGHSGFIVETKHSIIIMDPWLSKNGAFDAAWFQYPKNHHMADTVQKLFATSPKEKFIYISHEHKDHYDIEFLQSLNNRDFTLILADFFHPIVENDLEQHQFSCKDIVILKDNSPFHFQDGQIVLFIIDMELDADSAILVQTNTDVFLNLNDSKPHDRLATINEQYGPITIFSSQFSGAIWHPTCYKMEEEHYNDICQQKNHNKFATIAHAIELLNPHVFFPSAGPPCFLDPLLMPIHYKKVNTHPRAPQLLAYLNHYFANKTCRTLMPELMPGDVFDTTCNEFIERSTQRVDDSEFMPYIETYADEYKEFFAKRTRENALINPKAVFQDLNDELKAKLNRMHLVRKNIPTPLYFALDDYMEAMYCIDFQKNTITTIPKNEPLDSPDDPNFFAISAPAWQIAKVLSHQISWADFALTFRVTLERKPEIYNTLSHAYLTLDGDRLEHFCQLFHTILSKNERITVTTADSAYSILRYCPHQGGDLLNARIENDILTCPRHCWKFDLQKNGHCTHNDTTIDAKKVTPNN